MFITNTEKRENNDAFFDKQVLKVNTKVYTHFNQKKIALTFYISIFALASPSSHKQNELTLLSFLLGKEHT